MMAQETILFNLGLSNLDLLAHYILYPISAPPRQVWLYNLTIYA